MSPQVIAALLTGLCSLVVSLIAVLQSRASSTRTQRVQKEIEEMKARLADQSSETNARRAYRFDARRKLYDSVAPAMFQLTELADAALTEISYLCEPTLWQGYALGPEPRLELRTRGWIGSTSYEIVSAAYALLSPLAIYRMVQRRMTTFDLSLDTQVYSQWCLVRAAYQSFQRDAAIAHLAPALDYDPDVPNWRTLRAECPSKYWWQGVTRGRLDNAIDLILVDDGPAHMRVATFGEFERCFKEASAHGGDNEKSLGVFTNALFDFRATDRPVYVRLLTIQSVLYRAMYRIGTRGEGAATLREVADWLRLDDDLAGLFERSGGESVDNLRAVSNEYLRRYVLPAFTDPHLAIDVGQGLLAR